MPTLDRESMAGTAGDGARADTLMRTVLAVTALAAAALAIAITPEPGWTAASGLAGWPRLGLYALSGVLLGLSAPTGCLARRLCVVPVGRRAYLSLTLALLIGSVVTLGLVARLRQDFADPLGPWLWAVAMVSVAFAGVLPEVRRIGWRALWPRRPGGKADLLWPWHGPLLLAVLIGLAIITRLPALGTIPSGINPDEGDRAMTALDVLGGRGRGSWFDSGWYYISMVYFRVLAASFWAFGSDVAGGRMLSALCGIGFVAAIAWCGVRSFGWRTGLVATAFATGAGINLQHSRLITEAGPTALLWAISIGGFLEGARTGRIWAWAVAGLTGGLGLYFYPSARLWAVGAALTVAILLLYLRDRRALPGVMVATAAALIAAAPFLVHLGLHREETAIRYLQTAVLDPNNQVRLSYLSPPEPLPELLALQVERTLGMFDRYPDHGGFYPSERPIFGVPLAQLALIGAVYLLVRARRDVRLAILSVWFWLGLSGVALTVETPNVLRSVGALPSLCFVLAVPLVDLVDRALGSGPAPQRVLPRLAPVVVAAAAIVPEVLLYFATFRTLPEAWGELNREAQVVAALGAHGPVYSLEMSEHTVSSGWVRVLASQALRGQVPNPGRELPAVATSASPVAQRGGRPELIPAEGQALSVLLLDDANQQPYVSLLRGLYPGGTVGDAGDGRLAFHVPPAAVAATRGVTVIAPDGLTRVVDRFGEVPPDLALPARLSWSSGIRLPRGGRYRLAASTPGLVQVRLDAVTLADAPASTTVEVLAAPGLHFLELVADVSGAEQQVGLTLTGPDGNPRQLAGIETYRPMQAPWGLLARLARPRQSQPAGGPADAFLDTTVAMAFFDPEIGSISVPNTITWSGSLLAARGGVYRMAFAADDPVRVEIDGRPVEVASVTPERWSSVGPGSEVRLSEGWHAVRITLEVTHDEREVIRWNWVPPTPNGTIDATGAWSVVPPTALRPDPPVELVSGTPR